MALAMAVIFSVAAFADDKPIDFDRLPTAVREYVKINFPGVKPLYAIVDDDFFRPDYKVVLSSGVKMEFKHGGDLEKIECREGAVPASILPAQISEYVASHYPESYVKEYEVDKHSYEVKLSNGLELKFSTSFYLVEIDD